MTDRSLRGYRAVETIYHAYLTGLILMVVSRRGGSDAAELVFRLFRRQQLETFLPGLEKLGLRSLPHAVACAQYHDLSNDLDGVRVEYMYESDRKAWVRYVLRAGSTTAPRSAACRARSPARSSAAGTPATACCSAIRGSASSAPS
jgi:hypothetical protein